MPTAEGQVSSSGPKSASSISRVRDTRADKQTYHGFDALRGIAALAVVAFHASEAIGNPWLAGSGYLAVDLFFVMSGFVIAHSYEARIPELGVSGFMKVRIIRFLPLFYLGGLLGVVRLALLAATGHATDVSLSGIASYFLFLPAPPDASPTGSLAPLNGPGWSLLLEIYVNLAYALILPRLSNRVLVLIVAGSCAALLWHGLMQQPFSGGAHWSEIGLALCRVSYSFPLGLLLFRVRHRWGRIQTPQLLVLVLFWISVTVLPNFWWDYAFALVVSPLLVILASTSHKPSFISRYGANTSYGIYALHYPVLLMASGLANVLNERSYAIPIAAILALMIVTPYIDRHFDRPLRKRLLGRFGPSPVPSQS